MTSPTLHKYEVVLMSKDSNGGHEILTVEDAGELNEFYEWLQDMRVVQFEQVMLDKTDMNSSVAFASYKLTDLGRRETVLLVVANIVSIRRASA